MAVVNSILPHNLWHMPQHEAAAAIDALEEQNDPAAVALLLEILRWRQLSTIQEDVRTGLLAWRAVVALGRIADAAAVPFLVAAAYEEFSLLRGAVVVALAQIALRSDDPAVQALIASHLRAMLADRGILSAYWQWRVCDEAQKQLEQIEEAPSAEDLMLRLKRR